MSNKDQLILTDCVVDPDEAFEFFLDDLVEGWCGIIEVGVAQRGPGGRGITQKYSRSWVLAASKAAAERIAKDSGDRLERLQIGDNISVLRQERGDVYFFVNGYQKGEALHAVPANVYGMVVLHSRAASSSHKQQDPIPPAKPPVQPPVSVPPPDLPAPAIATKPPPPEDRPPRPKTGLSRLLSVPAEWTHQKDSTGGATKLIPLEETSREYKIVRDEFRKTARNNIKRIERVQNNMMYQRYKLSLHQVQQNLSPEIQIERKLFHGTQRETIENIQNSGFNRGYAGKNATKYGVGTYFAVSARYSAKELYSPVGEDGLRYMFLCRVIVGRYCLGTQGMIEPSIIPGKTERYDSAADNLSRPSMFITFKDDHAYPEYLITFS